MAGTWTIVRGFNPAHDCYRTSVVAWSEHVGPTAYSFKPFARKSGKEYVWRQQIQSRRLPDMESATAAAGWESRNAAAPDQLEHVYVLARTENFVLIYYTGYGKSAGNYVGVRVLARNVAHEFTRATEAAFQAAIDASGLAAGMRVAEFCVNEV